MYFRASCSDGEMPLRLPGSLFNSMHNIPHRKQKLIPGGQWKFHSSRFVLKTVLLSFCERFNESKEALDIKRS